MDRKKIALMIIAAGLLLLAIVIYLIYFSHSSSPLVQQGRKVFHTGQLPSSQTQTKSGDQTKTSKKQAKIDLGEKKKEPKEISKESLARLAASFAERFGTFSNQANFDNIKDLELLMTDSMRVWSQDYIDKLKSEETSGEFYAITTKAINSQVVNFDEANGQAEVKVVTQRQEVKGKAEPQTFYQDIVLHFQKQGDKWKVDSIEWGEK
jgi:hypothetical protein